MKKNLIFCAVCLCLISGCMAVIVPGAESRKLKEVTLLKDKGYFIEDKILLIDISGVIRMDSPQGLLSSRTLSPEKIKAILTKAKADKDIKAILLRVDCPGGGVTATDVITHEIKSFAEKKNIPVYAHVLGMAASGGYYVATAADRIYAEPTSVTGSIGVIMALSNFEGLAGKVGYKRVVIKSGEMKDIGNAFREMSSDERKVFQGIIGDMYDRFLETVVKNRSTIADKETLSPLADGRIFTAAQAQKSGLVDEVGHITKTMADLKKAAGLKKSKLVTYRTDNREHPNFYSPSAMQKNGILQIEAPAGWPLDVGGFYYLWSAGK